MSQKAIWAFIKPLNFLFISTRSFDLFNTMFWTLSLTFFLFFFFKTDYLCHIEVTAHVQFQQEVKIQVSVEVVFLSLLLTLNFTLLKFL